MLEKCDVVRFLVKEGIRALDNPRSPMDYLRRAAMKKTQLLFWVGEIRRGRDDLSDEKKPGRPATASLDEILAYRLERDPQTTVRRLAASLGIWPQTVVACTKGLG
jgi:hypothetical protein